MMRAEHSFGPFIQPDSKLLILGSFPSVKSREQGFYYGHPQNRFWKVLAACFQEEVPCTLQQKKDFLMRHQIALYDVIESCEIEGSSDASIRDVIVSDLASLLENSSIQMILLNGRLAEKLFLKYHSLNVPYAGLPSTSPANASCSLENLIFTYQQYLKKV